jgi:hypothetical protein
MILNYDIVFNSKNLKDSKLDKSQRMRFGEVINISKKIPKFDIFLEPYDELLRNKLIHGDFSIDYVNRKIVYLGGETKFEKLLQNTRNISSIFVTYAWAIFYDLRMDMEKAYTFLDNLEIK